MAASSDDYTWIADWGLFENAYCLTLIRDVEPDRLLDQLRAEDVRTGLSIDGVCETSYEVDVNAGRQFVGVTVVDSCGR